MVYAKQQIPKTCGVCRTAFYGKTNQKYCSRKCAKQRQGEQLADLTAYRRHCPHCGKALPSKSGRSRKRSVSGPEAPFVPQLVASDPSKQDSPNCNGP
jgi:hypothetical protein